MKKRVYLIKRNAGYLKHLYDVPHGKGQLTMFRADFGLTQQQIHVVSCP